MRKQIFKGHQEIVQLLIQHKADLNVKTIFGWTPLHLACSQDDIELVHLLVRSGANVNATDNQGRSILKWVCETGSKDIFQYLKNHNGKDFDLSTKRRSSQHSNKRRRNLTSVSFVSMPTSKVKC